MLATVSHPTMGAWIEILKCRGASGLLDGRTPRWVRGLKSDHGIRGTKKMYGRTPRWVRGLK